FNEYYVLDVLMTGDPRSDEGVRASGVVTYELATGEIHVFRAKSVVFASGGFGKIFKTTSNAHTLTGDGPAMALRRGIPLEDMEFFQFHPTGLAGLGILLSEAARGEGGVLRNNDMERFMERYAPTLKDLAPRDVVARAMANEVREGGGAGPKKEYVYLDLTHLEPSHIDAKLPDITEFARTYLGVEPYTDPIPVFPTAHYGMGGIPTNIQGEVLRNATDTIPGLYAAGETAWAPTRCWTSTSSAAAPASPPRSTPRWSRCRSCPRAWRIRPSSCCSVCATVPRPRTASPTSAATCRRPWTPTSRSSAATRPVARPWPTSSSSRSATRRSPSRTRGCATTWI